MHVQLDNVWATPSTLHGRVTVWGPDSRWRHQYEVAVPWDTIPYEAISAAFDRHLDREPAEESLLYLF